MLDIKLLDNLKGHVLDAVIAEIPNAAAKFKWGIQLFTVMLKLCCGIKERSLFT
jgi:hypothetical protein